MRFRARLARRLALVIVPASLAVGWIGMARSWRVFEEATAAAVLRAMVPERAACEADPLGFEATLGPGTAITAAGVEGVPGGPMIHPDLRARLEGGAPSAGRWTWDGRSTGELLVRMPWRRGPCRVVRFVWGPPAGRGPLWAGLGLLLRAGVAGALMFLLAMWAARPMERRLRHLADAVARGDLPPTPAEPGPSKSPKGDEVDVLADAIASGAEALRVSRDGERTHRHRLEELVDSVTHDIGTPVTVLLGELEILRRTARDQGTSPEVLDRMAQELHFVAALLGNLAVRTRLDTGSDHRPAGPVDLRQIVARVATRHQPLADSRAVSLETAVPDAPAPVRIDPVAAQQALGNLLQNAIIHGPAGGWAAMTLDVDGRRFVLEVTGGVTDEGPVTVEDSRSGAVGIGLQVTRRVVNDAGWTLGFEARPDSQVAIVEGTLAPGDEVSAPG